MNSLIVIYSTLKGKIPIRTIKEGDKILFSLEDVVSALATENTEATSAAGRYGLGGLVAATIKVLDPDEKIHLPTPGKDGESERNEVFVTEPGLYRVVTRDTSPAAKKFQRWIFHEVLPSIREYGVYPQPHLEAGSELMALANQLLQNTQILIMEIKERERLERETKERFAKNEHDIADLSEKLALVGLGTNLKEDYVSIEEICEQRQIGDSKMRSLIWAWAAKLCIENNRKSIPYGGKDDFELHKFPKDIVSQAIEKSIEQERL